MKKTQPNTNKLDKAVPGVVVGTMIGAAISPALPIVLLASAIGGVISYNTSEEE